jgi:hypothetical protein
MELAAEFTSPFACLALARFIVKDLFLKWGVSFLLCILTFQLADAQEPADSTVLKRIGFLQKSLQNDQKGTKQWWYSWLGIYGAATVGQGAVYFSSDNKAVREDMALGAITAFIGVAGQFISPFQPVSFADDLVRLPEGTDAERQAKLSLLEKSLADRSILESKARKWQAHILPTAINLGSGLVTWLGFHRTVWDGVVNFGLNCVLTESQIWSQPIRAKRALKRYHEQFGKGDLSVSAHREIKCNFIASARGAGVRVTF